MANRRLTSNWYKPGQEPDFLTLAKEGDILEVWMWLPFSSNHWGVLTSLAKDKVSSRVAHKVTGPPTGIAVVSLGEFANQQSYRINNSSDSLWTPGTVRQIVQGAMGSQGPNTVLSPYDFAVKCRANLLRGTPPSTLPKPSPNAVQVLPPLPHFNKNQ